MCIQRDKRLKPAFCLCGAAQSRSIPFSSVRAKILRIFLRKGEAAGGILVIIGRGSFDLSYLRSFSPVKRNLFCEKRMAKGIPCAIRKEDFL